MTLRVGLIGNGAIAHEVRAFAQKPDAGFEICGVFDVAPPPKDEMAENEPPFFDTIGGLLDSAPDLIVECASQEAVEQHGPAVLNAGISLVVISIGAFADDVLTAKLEKAASETGAQVILPSGAIAAIDALASAKLMGLTQVTYRSRKPPASWAGVKGAEIPDPATIKEPLVIYSGTAREATKLYPKNANVAATVAVAGLGFDDTTVELVADPGVTTNTHTVHAEGAFGRLDMQIENAPSPRNPRTSALTALSIVRTIQNQVAPIVV